MNGLAFAAVLRELHLEGLWLVTGPLAFNLGIETVQALLVLLVAPLLTLLARTHWLARVRQGTAAVAAVLALAWLCARITDIGLAELA